MRAASGHRALCGSIISSERFWFGAPIATGAFLGVLLTGHRIAAVAVLIIGLASTLSWVRAGKRLAQFAAAVDRAWQEYDDEMTRASDDFVAALSPARRLWDETDRGNRQSSDVEPNGHHEIAELMSKAEIDGDSEIFMGAQLLQEMTRAIQLSSQRGEEMSSESQRAIARAGQAVHEFHRHQANALERVVETLQRLRYPRRAKREFVSVLETASTLRDEFVAYDKSDNGGAQQVEFLASTQEFRERAAEVRMSVEKLNEKIFA